MQQVMGLPPSTFLPSLLLPCVHSAPQVDGREVWASAPLSTPGESCFVRAFVGGGASSLTLHARLASAAPKAAAAGAQQPVAKTVWASAAVVEARDWSWSARPLGQPPPFLDTLPDLAPLAPQPPADASAAAGSAPAALSARTSAGPGANCFVAPGVAAATSSLGLARFLLAHLAFAADAHLNAIRRATRAVTALAKGLSLPLAAGHAAIIAAAEVRLAAATAKRKPGKPLESPVTEADIAEAKVRAKRGEEGGLWPVTPARRPLPSQTLLRLRTPFVLDPCAATFDLILGVLRQSVPHACAEAAAAAAAGGAELAFAASAATVGVAGGAAAMPALEPADLEVRVCTCRSPSLLRVRPAPLLAPASSSAGRQPAMEQRRPLRAHPHAPQPARPLPARCRLPRHLAGGRGGGICGGRGWRRCQQRGLTCCTAPGAWARLSSAPRHRAGSRGSRRRRVISRVA